MCAVVLVVSTASAWGRLGHATVAKIAENHLTKKAKKQITEYMHGESIVKWASYADDYKPELLVDLGFEPSDAKRFITYPHTFEANEDCTPYRGIRKGDKYVKNCIYYIEKMAEDLKDDAVGTIQEKIEEKVEEKIEEKIEEKVDKVLHN